MEIGDRVSPFRIIPQKYEFDPLDRMECDWPKIEKEYLGKYLNRSGVIAEFMGNRLLVKFDPPCPYCSDDNNEHSTSMWFTFDELIPVSEK